MLKLIKTEFKKIFKRKSILIVSLILIGYTVLTNYIYKNMNNYLNSDSYDTEYINDLKNENTLLNLNDPNDLMTYADNMSRIEQYELLKSYSDESSKYVISNYVLDSIYKRDVVKYVTKDEDELKKLNKEIDELIAKINNKDWDYFTNLKIKNYEDSLKNETDEVEIAYIKEMIRLENYRLDNNLDYDSSNYLVAAINDITRLYKEYYTFEHFTKKLSSDEEENFNQIKEVILKANYILEHKQDINNNSSLGTVLQVFTSEFSLFILIYLIMISGTIVSDEFNKGTIKYLLTKPHKRSTILASKLITVLLMIPITIIFMVLVELIIGGFMLGFSSLSIPVVVYSAKTGLVTYNIFKYLLLSIIYAFPTYLVLAVIAFALSTFTTTSGAVTVTFLFYLISEVINSFIGAFPSLKFLKAFVSAHWNFQYLLDGSTSPFGFKTSTSLLVVVAYLIVILVPTFLYFSKKDVKNI